MKSIFILGILFLSVLSFGQTDSLVQIRIDSLVQAKVDSLVRVNIDSLVQSNIDSIFQSNVDTLKYEKIDIGAHQIYKVALTNSYEIIGSITNQNSENITIISKITGTHVIARKYISDISEYNEDFVPEIVKAGGKDKISITTEDGKSYKGIVSQEKNKIIIEDNYHKKDTILIASIKTIGQKNEKSTAPSIGLLRSMVGHTAFHLQKNELYYKTNGLVDHEIIYGVEDWFSVNAGTNFNVGTNGLGLGFYAGGHFGHQLTRYLHIGGTFEYAYHPRINSIFVDKSDEIAYATMTFGTSKAALTYSWGFSANHLVLSKDPIWSLAGMTTFGRFQLVAEVWRLDPYVDEEPFTVEVTSQAFFVGALFRLFYHKNIFELGFGIQNASSLSPGVFGGFTKIPVSLTFYHSFTKK